MSGRRGTWGALSAVAAIVVTLFLSPARADIVWKVGDEGPRAPDVRLILGDDTRTLAFCADGEYELTGTAWSPVPLKTETIVGTDASIFFAGGRFVATTDRDSQLLVFVLKGNDWTQLASIPSAYQWLVHSEERLFVFPRYFGSCDPSLSCPTDPSRNRLLSISFVDGSIRDEPILPACSGFPFVLSGKVHLIVTPPACGGADVAARGRRSATSPGLPFYRLDPGGWTALAPWTAPNWTLLSTPNSLWTIFGTGGIDYAAQILTTAGLSNPIPLPHDTSAQWPESIPMEWGGRLIVQTRGQAGNVLQLQNGSFVWLSPASPVTSKIWPSVFASGNRLFTWADGWNVFNLDGPAWSETSGITGTPGAASYMMGSTTTYALRGTRVFLREPEGWKPLPPAPRSEWTYDASVWMDRPVVYTGYNLAVPLSAFDASSGSWEDLHVPKNFGPPMLASGNELYVGGPPGQLARLRDGAWSIFSASPPPGERTGVATHLREANGVVYVTTSPSSSSSSSLDSPTYKIEGDHLVPAFTDLDPKIVISDIATVGGRPHLLVGDGSRDYVFRALVMAPTAAGYETLVTQEDIMWTEAGSYDLVWSLAASGEDLLLPSLFLARSELRAQRGQFLPRLIDPSGRFASGHLGPLFLPVDRSPLFVPSRRVRKNLAAVVDTTGSGGVPYRSTLTLANFSRTSQALARVFAGAGTVPALEVPLGPGVQRRIENPIPDFVGPLGMEFDGLTDERDAWAAVRVWSPSEGGTAGTSILATDPGSLPHRTVVLPPAGSSGHRTHVALSVSSDGARESIETIDYREGLGSTHPDVVIPNGGFLQVDPRPEVLAAPVGVLAVSSRGMPRSGGDDLLGYIVTNDAVTNDGTVVPFESPTTLPGRRTRFLPAVVSTSSEFGRYRTELSLGWRLWSDYPPLQPSVLVTYRAAEGSWSFPVTIDSRRILEVPDVGAWLAANGVPVDPSSFIGTLTFGSDRPEGAANLLVTAVVQSRGTAAYGDYGVSVPLFNEAQWATVEAIVPGLREDGPFRSNIALANPEPDGGSSVTLSASLRRASDGTPIGTLPSISLAPGQRSQLNRPLADFSASGDFYAVVSKVGGSGRFVAYGIVNDNITGDGTLLSMTSVR